MEEQKKKTENSECGCKKKSCKCEHSEDTSCENTKKEECCQESEVETLKKQADEYKDKWLRSVAEFDNYKKRNAKLWQDAFSEGVQSVIVKIFSIGDSLDWALTMELDEKTAEGIKGLKKKYDDTLKDIGLTEINPLNQPFDPNFSEAVMQEVAGEGEESDTVSKVLQKGYKINDKIIRYAKVCVRK